MASPIEITQSNFQSEVLDADVPVVVDLWAAWCGPCRMVAPIVEELAEDYQGRIKVGKLDVDAEPGLAAKFGVASIPTILLFKGGQVVAVAVGARPRPRWPQALELETYAAAAA